MSNTVSILDWIDFGKVSAERDENLSEYFFDNGVLQSVIKSPSSFLVLGRKGAGKTAVFRHMMANGKNLVDEKGEKLMNEDDIIVPFSFDDYNWQIHSLLVNQNKAESMLYRQSWRFIILIEALKAYISWFEKNDITPPSHITEASTIIKKIFSSPVPGILQVIGQKLLSLSSIKLPSGSLETWELNVGEVSFEAVKNEEALRTRLSENIENLIERFDLALSEAVNSAPRVFICFDRADEGWDEVAFDTSKKIIAGLVSATDSIVSTYNGRLRPIVFLREDIFETLSLNDSNKLRTDCGALLNWSRETLIELLMRRARYYAKKISIVIDGDIDVLFDRSEMRQRNKPSNYMLKRTMMRPRDFISFLNLIIQSLKDVTNDPFADEKIIFDKLSCEAIYNAEPAYSEWLKQEVLDEWKVQKPEIITLFQALQNNGSTNFTSKTLKTELEKISGEVSDQEVLEYLKFLFSNSIIGFKLGASNEWKFKCFYPSQGFVESDEYHVHEGLIRALNLTESRDR